MQRIHHFPDTKAWYNHGIKKWRTTFDEVPRLMQIITDAIREALVQLLSITGNLGLSILLFTLIIRSLLVPLSIPALRSQKKMRALQPELKKLKDKHGDDKKALQTAQMELYKKYNANPLSGCLPQIVQLVILIFLYRILVGFLNNPEAHGAIINTTFLWLDLSKPDGKYILPVLAGLTQLILSIMIMPGGEVADVVPNNSKDKKIQAENKKEEDTADMAAAMQKQMLFVMPITTAFIALRFPSGLTLYMIATTIFSIVQQYVLTGPGGLTSYTKKAFQSIKISIDKLLKKD
jgi:YidC/Oxa1 family membrane protein insertase